MGWAGILNCMGLPAFPPACLPSLSPLPLQLVPMGHAVCSANVGGGLVLDTATHANPHIASGHPSPSALLHLPGLQFSSLIAPSIASPGCPSLLGFWLREINLSQVRHDVMDAGQHMPWHARWVGMWGPFAGG